MPIPPDATENDLDQWRNEIKKIITKRRGNNQYRKHFNMIEEYEKSIYKKKSIYENLRFTPAGRLLVKGETNEDGSHTYWLLDKSGEVLRNISSTATSVTIGSPVISSTGENEEEEQLVYCTIVRIAREVKWTIYMSFWPNRICNSGIPIQPQTRKLLR